MLNSRRKRQIFFKQKLTFFQEKNETMISSNLFKFQLGRFIKVRKLKIKKISGKTSTLGPQIYFIVNNYRVIEILNLKKCSSL